MADFLKHILCDQTGATAVEYSLITGLIFIAIATTFSTLADAVNESWNKTGHEISEASG